MKGFRWLRHLNPLDAIAKRAGKKAVEGAIEAVAEKVTPKETPVDSKSIFKSKTFWFNVLSAAAEVSGLLAGVVPPGTLTLIVNGINVGLRLLADQPVHIVNKP